MKKKIVFIFSLILSLSFFLNINNVQYVIAEELLFDSVEYVSLGDSIAAGCMLPGHNEGDEAILREGVYNSGVFVEGGYSNSFKNYLMAEYGSKNVNATSFARSGDRTADLLNKLNNQSVATVIEKADIVTICIGANDILGPALDNLENFIFGQMSLTEMEQKLDEGLATFAGTNDIEGNFEKILNKLQDLNPNAKYIFTNVYNPYKFLAVPTALEFFIELYNSISTLDISVENVNGIATATEVYVAGGGNSSGRQVVGLNALLEEKINKFNDKNDTDYILVDVKSEFDKFTLQTETKYTDLVNCVFTKDAQIAIDFGVDIYTQIQQYADPHPTTNGHQIIYNQFIGGMENVASVNYDCQGGNFSGKTNKIVFVYNGDGLVENENIPTREGYNFVGWYKDSNLTQEWSFIDDRVQGNLMLYAKWEAIPVYYTVIFNSNGGSLIEAKSVISGGTACAPMEPTKTGYEFVGWYSNVQLTEGYDFNNAVTSDITLYAKWTPQKYAIIYKDAGNTSFSGTHGEGYPTQHTYNVTTKLVSPTKTGYSFDGWYLTSNCEGVAIMELTNGNFTSNITLYAKWVEVPVTKYTITFNSNGGSLVSSSKVNEGEKVNEPTTPTKLGYTFVGWYKDEQLTEGYDFNGSVTTSFTLYAKWEVIPPITYIVTFNSNGGSSVLSATVQSGAKVPKPLVPTRSGAENIFAGWYYNNELWDFENPINQNITLIAKWAGLVCENPNDAVQLINDIKVVTFKIDIDHSDVLWYVNNSLQEDAIGEKIFEFIPKQEVGSYQVYCVVNGVSSERFSVNVKYATPTEINIYLLRVDGDSYTFCMSNQSYYNPAYFVWYAAQSHYSEEVKKVGEGITCKIKLEASSDIYVVYEFGEEESYIKSNTLKVSTGNNVGNIIYIVLGVGGIVVGVVILVTLISKRRYKNFY